MWRQIAATVGANIARFAQRSTHRPHPNGQLPPDGHVVHQVNHSFTQEDGGIHMQDIMVQHEETCDQKDKDDGQLGGHKICLTIGA